MWAAVLALHLACAAEPAQVVVVCPDDLQPGITDWQTIRTQQGWNVVLIRPTSDPDSTRANIRSVAKPGDYVLLLGDSLLPQVAPNLPSKHTPTWYLPTPISARFGSTDQSASDLPYADLDGDGLPDARVGRIPADHAPELQQILARTLAAESNAHFGEWRRQINLVAGVGGFGLIADTAIETAAGGLIQSMLPTSLQTSVTYASPSSPFFPVTNSFANSHINDSAKTHSLGSISAMGKSPHLIAFPAMDFPFSPTLKPVSLPNPNMRPHSLYSWHVTPVLLMREKIAYRKISCALPADLASCSREPV